jgi:hypothetical protein
VWLPAILAARGIRPTCLLRYDWLQQDARARGYFHAMSGKTDPELIALLEARWAAFDTAGV